METKLNSKIDHLFRQESGKMVAVLVNIFGTEHLELAEDVVQNTLLKAFEVWKYKGLPDNPQAWLYRVAKNNAIDIIRREKRNSLFDFSEPEHQLLTSEYTLTTTINDFWEEGSIKDDFLAMMFASCHPDISSENQVTFILKTLCGFSTREIAKAFLTSEDIISKRIYRTKEHFRKNNIRPKIPKNEELESRLAAIMSVIYLMFNEGYHSIDAKNLIRQDLISQALYLGKTLLENDRTNFSEVSALMALMCFHASRSDSRISTEGDIILLKDQNRDKWNKELIEAGRKYLLTSKQDNRISMYHFEALISLEHCKSASYNSTNWATILTYYEKMLALKFDPVVYLNKCVVKMELVGAKAALKDLEQVKDHKHLQKYYLYHATLGEIYLRLDDIPNAKKSISNAIQLTKSEQEKQFLKKKLATIS